MIVPGIHELTGDFFSVAIANPGAGIQFTWPVPGSLHIQILGLTFVFTTSAAAANRQLFLVYGIDALVGLTVASPIIQPASTGKRYSFFIGSDSSPSPVATSPVNIPLPSHILLRFPDDIASSVILMDAGDAFSQIVLTYRAWPNLY